MNQKQIKEAYRLANKYAETKEEAVQVGIQMALNGELIFDENDNILSID